jgi:LPS sulfotransferase NodH
MGRVSGPSVRAVALHARAAGRVALRGGSLRDRLGRPDDRLVFVIGSPRSGTTFLARSVGSLAGFVDLGEVAPLKAAIPELWTVPPAEAARRVRRIVEVTRRLGLAGGRRPVEQTPESAYVTDAIAIAFPQACFLHIVRDGRDVACSLLERGWLSAGRGGADDAGHSYGAEPRFWVEPERRQEFAVASDARRAAWAWRRYVTAALAAPADRTLELRYERLVTDPAAVAADVAAFLSVPRDELAPYLDRAHRESVGRYRDDLTAEQQAEVETEAGGLLRELGYLDATA